MVQRSGSPELARSAGSGNAAVTVTVRDRFSQRQALKACALPSTARLPSLLLLHAPLGADRRRHWSWRSALALVTRLVYNKTICK